MKYKQEHQDGGLGLSIYLVVEVPSYAENNKPNQTERLESQMGCHGLSLHTFLFLDWHWVLLNLVLRLWGQQNFWGHLGLVGLSFLQYRLGGLLFWNLSSTTFISSSLSVFALHCFSTLSSFLSWISSFSRTCGAVFLTKSRTVFNFFITWQALSLPLIE